MHGHDVPTHTRTHPDIYTHLPPLSVKTEDDINTNVNIVKNNMLSLGLKSNFLQCSKRFISPEMTIHCGLGSHISS